MPDFVKLVNESHQSFDFHQSNAKRIIAPGEDVIVPWPIAVTLFGHPNLPNVAPANERTRMYEKIRARHSFSAGLQTEEDWFAMKPSITVWDIENDQQVVMLIDDPEGIHSASAPDFKAASKEGDMGAVMKQIATLTKQVERMAAKDNQVPQEPAAGNSDSPTPIEDGPGTTQATDLDDVFKLPMAGDDDPIPSADDPQAVGVGEDTPPPPKPVAGPAKKVVAKKVAAQR